MTTVSQSKRDGSLEYTKTALYNTATKWKYSIQIPSIYPPVYDRYGSQRWNEDRKAVKDNQLSDDAITPILNLLKRSHAAIFHPSPLVLQLQVNWPPIAFSDELLVNYAEFDPLPESNQNIIMTLYHENAHWYMLVHFIPIQSVLIFNSSTAHANITLSIDQDKPTYEQNLSSFSPINRNALDRYKMFTAGSRAAPSSTEENGLWDYITSVGNSQTDDWSCGLWCMGLNSLIYNVVSDHHAVYGTNINFSRIRDEIVTLCSNRNVERMSVPEANRMLEAEWNNQWQCI